MVSNIFGLSSPLPGEMIQFDLRIFFKWVGSTTNKIDIALGTVSSCHTHEISRFLVGWHPPNRSRGSIAPFPAGLATTERRGGPRDVANQRFCKKPITGHGADWSSGSTPNSSTHFNTPFHKVPLLPPIWTILDRNRHKCVVFMCFQSFLVCISHVWGEGKRSNFVTIYCMYF